MPVQCCSYSEGRSSSVLTVFSAAGGLKEIRSLRVLVFAFLLLALQAVPVAKSATCTTHISSPAQLGLINSARPGAVVCVAGSVRADAINITASGTAANPIVLQGFDRPCTHVPPALSQTDPDQTEMRMAFRIASILPLNS
jgi:hypothetical protein